MIGQHAQPATHRETLKRQGRSRFSRAGRADQAMFLMHIHHRQAGQRQRTAGQADQAIAGMRPMLVGTDILGQRQAAGIDQQMVAATMPAGDRS